MKHVFLTLFMSLTVLLSYQCEFPDGMKLGKENPDLPNVPNPDQLSLYISDIQYEWEEKIGGGGLPEATIHHVDTRAWVEIKKKGKPRLVDYEKAHLLPHPDAKATKFLKRRNWP